MTEREQKIQQRRIIKITKCLSEPCPMYYTDTLSESILVICENPKHNADTDNQKRVEEEEGNVSRPANPKPQPAQINNHHQPARLSEEVF